MENADKQLKKLGYKNIGNNYYKNRFNSHIYFREDKSIDVSGRGGSKNKEIPLEQLQAIITKASELGWLEIKGNEMLLNLLREKQEKIESMDEKLKEILEENQKLKAENKKKDEMFKKAITEMLSERYYGER